MAAVDLLRQYDVPFNTLTSVHRFNATRPLDVYRFLRREIGSTYMQFIRSCRRVGSRRVRPALLDLCSCRCVGRRGRCRAIPHRW